MTTDALLWALDNAHRQTVALCEDITDAQLVEQPFDGVNHPAWILGHLFLLDAYVADVLAPSDAARLDERWVAAYGPGSVPLADGPAYLSKSAYLDRLDTVRAAVIGAIASLDEAALDAPLPDEIGREEFPTTAHLLQYVLWHEAFHAGQLSAWRKAMGLASAPVAFGVMPRARVGG